LCRLLFHHAVFPTSAIFSQSVWILLRKFPECGIAAVDVEIDREENN
jgi:hypothetical protein